MEEIEWYYWIGKYLVWTAVTVLLFLLVRYILRKIINYCADVFPKLWYVIEFLYHRKAFLKWVKFKERHPKFKEERYDPKFTPPFRVGRRLGRVVLDSKGLKVVHFESEEQAEKYCDYLNK